MTREPNALQIQTIGHELMALKERDPEAYLALLTSLSDMLDAIKQLPED